MTKSITENHIKRFKNGLKRCSVLRDLLVLYSVPSLVFNIHIRQLTTACNFSSRECNILRPQNVGIINFTSTYTIYALGRKKW